MKNLFLLISFLYSTLIAQSLSVTKIEPPFWFESVKWDTLQLMIYGNELKNAEAVSGSPNFNILRTYNAGSENYLFVDIDARKLDAGKYKLNFIKNGKSVSTEYEIKKREFEAESHAGFGKEDIIYLLFIDRFANGDTKNDKIQNKFEEFNFGDLNGRHGGDILGMIDKLNYLSELGITAIWHTPALENNMYMSYHGYAATDLYKIDPRLGTNELYKKFVAAAHAKNIKVISDHVSNHIGINHIWCKDPPFADWFHGTIKKHLEANHNKIAFFDVHADKDTPKKIVEGWFTDYMPDLNKDNPFLAKYMIQNTLWWIEYSGIDGIREDTYPYNELGFMARWAKVIFDNYPNFNIVGEVWKGKPAFLSMYQKNPKRESGFNSHLKTITDFAFSDAIRRFLSGGGLWGVYETLAKDFLYFDPSMLMTFIDNHDIDRALYVAGEDADKYKLALTILLTARGIPQITYGSEIAFKGGSHHGRIRAPMPGGFPGDVKNVFSKNSLDETERMIFDFLNKLIDLRRTYKSLSLGKFIHFPPVEDLYVYLREYEDEVILIAINGSAENRKILPSKYFGQFGRFTRMVNLLNGEIIDLNETGEISAASKSSLIFLLKR